MSRTKTAVIPAISHAPARDAHVSLAYQWAVDMGTQTADGCLMQLSDIPLHAFVPGCLAQFKSVMQKATEDTGHAVPPLEMLAAVDAFAAGLLGRLQQYLMAGLAEPMRTVERATGPLH